VNGGGGDDIGCLKN